MEKGERGGGRVPSPFSFPLLPLSPRFPETRQPQLRLVNEWFERLVRRLPLAQHFAVFLPRLRAAAERLVGRRAEPPHPPEHPPPHAGAVPWYRRRRKS